MAICCGRAVLFPFHCCILDVVRDAFVVFMFDVLGKIRNSIESVFDHCLFIYFILTHGRAKVLGSFQCRDVLLLWHIAGQGPAVLAAGAGRVVFFLFLFLFSYRQSSLPFLMLHLLGDGWT